MKLLASQVVLDRRLLYIPEGRRHQFVCWVGLIPGHCEGFAGKAGGVDVLQGVEGCLDDLPS